MQLYSFQRLARVEQLSTDGMLTSDWDRLRPTERDAYPAMVSAMERAGIRTAGRPPVWAWGDLPTTRWDDLVLGRPA